MAFQRNYSTNLSEENGGRYLNDVRKNVKQFLPIPHSWTAGGTDFKYLVNSRSLSTCILFWVNPLPSQSADVIQVCHLEQLITHPRNRPPMFNRSGCGRSTCCCCSCACATSSTCSSPSSASPSSTSPQTTGTTCSVVTRDGGREILELESEGPILTTG